MLFITPILNGYSSLKAAPMKAPDKKSAPPATLAQSSIDHTAFGKRVKAGINEANAESRIKADAKKLGDKGRLKELLKEHPVFESFKYIKTDVTRSRFSQAKGTEPTLSVKYNMWENPFLCEYSVKTGDTLETRTFDPKGNPSTTTIERSLGEVDIVKEFTGHEKKPFSIKIERKPTELYTTAGAIKVTKSYNQDQNTRSASILESYEYTLREETVRVFGIAYPNKTRKNYIVSFGTESKGKLSTLELARERAFELMREGCGEHITEKMKGYAQLLDSVEKDN